MRSTNERSSQAANHRSITRILLWTVFLVAGLVLTSCGTDSVEERVAAAGQIDADSADELADARGQLEDLYDSGSLGSGNGVITIDGVDYPFEAQVCYNAQGSFEASGPGQTADGIPYWASLSNGVTTRQSMEGIGMSDQALDAFFGGKDAIESFGLEVELGKDGAFGSGDDAMADFAIDAIDVADSNDLNFRIDGPTISGSGSVTDYNGVAIDYGDSRPVTFSASCG